MIRLKLSVVRRYAEGKSPFVGIPIVQDGSRGPAIFHRHILQSALEAPGHRHVFYDTEKFLLVINGGRNEYRLIDQSRGSTPVWKIREAQDRWAKGHAKSRASRALAKSNPNATLIKRTRVAIAKLERQREKLWVRKPVNPLLHEGDREGSRRYESQYWTDWLSQKNIRKALSRIAKGGAGKSGLTWAQFDALLAKAIGHETLSRACKYPVISHWKNGPTWESYWQHLPKHLGLTQKPWNAGPWKFDAEQVRKSRAEYCEALRAKLEIDEQITALQSLLRQYEG